MKATKIKIKNLFGISEYETDGKSLEITGRNGVGKTSVIDAIRYALTNKSERDYIVRNGENEGEIIIETDTGLKIHRKKRTNQADYKSVKSDGKEVGSPESFLRDIFTPLQLNPVEFIGLDKNKQNSMILDMVEYSWDMSKIKEWFGEIPDWVSYDQNILAVLDDIQSEKGEYYQSRQNVNRDIRNKRAFMEEIAATIPVGYSVEKWESANVGDLYRQIERIRKENEVIERARRIVEERDNKHRSFQAEKEIATAAIEKEFAATKNRLQTSIAKLTEEVKSYEKELSTLDERKRDKIKIAEQEYENRIAEYNAKASDNEVYANVEPKDYSNLQEQAEHIEKMKAHINEYRRMERLQEEIEFLSAASENLTEKIEKARELPGQILEEASIPITGLTVKDGVPLINGLPVSNLSEGEKLDLCIDVAIQKPNGLQIILIDGVEKLAKDMREKLYEKCKAKGLQFIATRTTDDEDLTVIEL